MYVLTIIRVIFHPLDPVYLHQHDGSHMFNFVSTTNRAIVNRLDIKVGEIYNNY